MQEFFSEKGKVFLSGTIIGWIAGAKLLFDAPRTWDSLVIEYTLKFTATCVFAFMSGLFTVLAKDFYDGVIKPKLFKNKKK